MSDFLTRMAQLSRGEAPVVAPRLPSLFAPTMDVGLTETAIVNTQQQGKINPATDTPETTATAVSDVAGHSEPRQSTPTIAQPATAPLHRESITSRPEITEHRSESTFTLQNDDPIAPATVSASNKTANTATTGRDPQPLAPLPEKVQTLLPTNIEVALDAPAESNDQPGTTVAQSSLPLVRDYKSQQTAPQQFFSELPNTEPAAEQQPTVHINIGRIEVRAQTAAPAAPARPARPKPQRNLTLNDYLKRNGGRS
jgi:hypothetical protein